MLLFTSLCLITWMLSVESMIKPDGDKKYSLDMADKSVDDMYSKCKEEMKGIIENYFQNELKEDPFADAWNKEKTIAEEITTKGDSLLSLEERTAVRVYTNNKNGIYRDFNSQVRGEKAFTSHILHFYLTSAMQRLQANSKDKCYTSYRRNSHEIEGTVGGIIRFGFFASSSLSPDQTDYGKGTCFQIKTCHGAYFGDISVFPKEKEVLIPPYETFHIKEKLDKDKKGKLEDCKIVYVLESAGVKSNMDCRLWKLNEFMKFLKRRGRAVNF